jgi:tetraacyldisaccharide 4'-kinase
MDDGFQHRRLARDLDIVLIDALWPFGGGYMLPRGLLREPPRALNRADFLIVTRTNLVDPERLEEIRGRLAEVAPEIPVANCEVVPTVMRELGGNRELPARRLRRGRWGAFCGIGNPEGFGETLRRVGCEVEFLEVYPDHMSYDREGVTALLDRASRLECIGLVTTEKDAVKVEPLLEEGAAQPGVYALKTDLEFSKGSQDLTAALLRAAGKMV